MFFQSKCFAPAIRLQNRMQAIACRYKLRYENVII